MKNVALVLMALLALLLPAQASADPWISTRTHSTCAVMKKAYGGYPANQLYCWGSQTNCQGITCGPSPTSYPTPKSTASDVKMVAKFDYGTCYLTNAGEVKCWGLNSDGQTSAPLTTPYLPTPVSVIASGVGFIAGGAKHVCAVMNTTGEVRCWGDNSEGQLGNGTTTDSRFPVTAVASGIGSLGVGGNTTCGRVAASNTVKCWGERHGNASPAGYQVTPTIVGGLLSTTTVQVGDEHVCVTDGGAAKCWGLNTYGQLGNNTTTSSATPVAATVMTSGVSGVLAGNGFSCGAVGAAVYCWGLNASGQLGLGDTTNRDEPTLLSTVIAGVGSWLSAGTDNACAYVAPAPFGNLRYYCWGANASKQLGPKPDGTWPANPTTTPFEFYFWNGPN